MRQYGTTYEYGIQASLIETVIRLSTIETPLRMSTIVTLPRLSPKGQDLNHKQQSAPPMIRLMMRKIITILIMSALPTYQT